MYLLSETLKNKINEIAERVRRQSNGLFVFEEYIAIPYYGHIILRFNITSSDYTLTDLTAYEQEIYSLIDDDFLIDFMGSVYKNVGFDLANMEQIFKKCGQYYNDEKLIESRYASEIRNDGKYLLKACGYDETLDVWEIQVDEDELALLILADETTFKGSCEVEGKKVEIIEANRKQCEGLMKTILYAKRKHISLIEAEMSVQNLINNGF